MEIWLKIKEFGNLYEVSNLGNIRNSKRLMSLNKDKNGYLTVGFFYNKKRKTCKVHRLVAKTFIKNTDSKLEVNHIDGIKSNNCVSNLEWCTRKENMKHASKSNLLIGMIGSKNISSKLKEHDVKEIRTLYDQGKNYKNICVIYGIQKSQFYNIINRGNWKHV